MNNAEIKINSTKTYDVFKIKYIVDGRINDYNAVRTSLQKLL